MLGHISAVVLARACAVVSRIEFWGEFLDLVGLAVLLSDEVWLLRWLRWIILHMPFLDYGTYVDLSSNLHDALDRFEEQYPGNYRPSQLAKLEGRQAKLFARLFQDWPKLKRIPNAVFACAVLRRDRPGVPALIYPSLTELPNDRKLEETNACANEMRSDEFFRVLGKREMSAIYSPGFFLMLLATCLVILGMFLHP